MSNGITVHPGASGFLSDRFSEALREQDRKLRDEVAQHEAAKKKAAAYSPPWEVVFNRKACEVPHLPALVLVEGHGAKQGQPRTFKFTQRGPGCAYDAFMPAKNQDHRYFSAVVVEAWEPFLRPGDIVQGFREQVMPLHVRGAARIIKEEVYTRVRSSCLGFHTITLPDAELMLFG